MAYTPVPTKADGDAAYTASDINTYIRDNWLAGLPDIFTTAGDLCYASAADTAARLGIGTVGYVLKSTGSLPAWAIHPTKDIVTTKGDILAATAADTLARVGVGANISHVIADSSQTPGMRWSNNNALGGSNIDGQGALNTTPLSLNFVGTTSFDIGWNVATSSLVVPTTGYYYITIAGLQLASSSAWGVNEYLYVDVYNSTTTTQLCVLAELYIQSAGTLVTSISGGDILYLTATNSILIRVYQNSGSTILVTNDTLRLGIARIGV